MHRGQFNAAPPTAIKPGMHINAVRVRPSVPLALTPRTHYCINSAGGPSDPAAEMEIKAAIVCLIAQTALGAVLMEFDAALRLFALPTALSSESDLRPTRHLYLAFQ